MNLIQSGKEGGGKSGEKKTPLSIHLVLLEEKPTSFIYSAMGGQRKKFTGRKKRAMHLKIIEMKEMGERRGKLRMQFPHGGGLRKFRKKRFDSILLQK